MNRDSINLAEVNEALKPLHLVAADGGHGFFRINTLPVPTRGEQVAELCFNSETAMFQRDNFVALIDRERQQARDTAFEEAAKVFERYWEVEKRHGATSQQRADDAANYAISIRMGIGTGEATK